MTLNKAIEILEIEKGTASLQDDPAFYKALDLGIEALKRIQLYRPEVGVDVFALLRGETEEGEKP